MAQHTESDTTGATEGSRGTSAWVGWIAFAGIILIMLGTFHLMQGFVALTNDDYYLVDSSGLVVDMDYTAWGWVHLIGGVILIMAGVGVFSGKVWARVVGTLVALVSAIVNLAFLSAYPVQSILMIALCVVIIMALTVHGSEIKASD